MLVEFQPTVHVSLGGIHLPKPDDLLQAVRVRADFLGIYHLSDTGLNAIGHQFREGVVELRGFRERRTFCNERAPEQ